MKKPENITAVSESVEESGGQTKAKPEISLEPKISPEERRKAEEIVLETLELGATENLANFDELLKNAAQALPQYKKIKEKLKEAEQQSLPYELFKVFKKNSNDLNIDPNAPRDGVLLKSIKQGSLECAGRTLIASTLLQERGADHAVATAPGHAFLVIEMSSDTLAYFDANNNIYFTFPKQALIGYQGVEATSECRFGEYAPRQTDYVDGINSVYSHFVVLPAREGVGRQYLSNVASALDGPKENEDFYFDKSGVKKDKKASENLRLIEDEIYGQNKVYENFVSQLVIKNKQGEDSGLIKQAEKQKEVDREAFVDILRISPSREDFATSLSKVLSGNIGDRIPYIKHASLEQKKVYAEKVWDLLHKIGIDKMISGR